MHRGEKERAAISGKLERKEERKRITKGRLAGSCIAGFGRTSFNTARLTSSMAGYWLLSLWGMYVCRPPPPVPQASGCRSSSYVREDQFKTFADGDGGGKVSVSCA